MESPPSPTYTPMIRDLPVDLIVRGHDDASPIALIAKLEGRRL